MKAVIFVCLLSLIALSSQSVFDNSCFKIVGPSKVLFNLCEFAQRGPYSVQNSLNGYEYNFSLITPRVTPCSQNTGAKIFATQDEFATKAKCENIASDAPSYSVYNTTDNTGIQMTFPTNGTNQLTVIVTCDRGMTSQQDTTFSAINSSISSVVLMGGSSMGCPYTSMDLVSQFIGNNRVIFGVVAIIVGLFVTFLGLKVFNISIFLIVATFGSLLIFIIFMLFVPFGSQDWIYYVIIGASICVGLLKGYLALRYEKVGFFLLGGWLGLVGGYFVFDVVVLHFTKQNVYIFYATIGVCMLIGGLIAIWLWKDVIIIATSIIGGYLTIRALSLFLGHFPNEVDVAKGTEPMDYFAYAYLAGAIVLALCGILYQYRVKRRESEEEERKDDPVASYYTRT